MRQVCFVIEGPGEADAPDFASESGSLTSGRGHHCDIYEMGSSLVIKHNNPTGGLKLGS
jgi:hypothetical protein